MRRHRVEWLRGAIAGLAVAAASGCTPHSYAGIDLRPGRAPAEVQTLAARAQAGDKQAQLELGMRYETGRGLPRNPVRAERLYATASRSSGGRLVVYVPAAAGMPSRLEAVDRPLVPGLAEARLRLERLRAGRDLSR